MAIESGPYVGRTGTDAEFSRLFDRIIGSGTDQGGALQVTADSGGLRVFVNTGYGCVRGHFVRVHTSPEEIPIDGGDSQPRIDTVVLELDYAATPDLIQIKVIKGTPASTPSAPALTQTEVGIYQEPLANLAVGANAVTIAAGNVSDRRRTFIDGMRQRAGIFVQSAAPDHAPGRVWIKTP